MKLSLCNTAYYIKGGKPIVYMFCRDYTGRRIIIKDNTFEPYFYIDNEAFIERCKYKPILVNLLKDKRIKRTEIVPKSELVSIDGKQVRKIICRIPTNVRDIRDRFTKFVIDIYEADVLFHLRFLIDNDIFCGVNYDSIAERWTSPAEMPSNYKILYLDIEALCRNKEAMKKRTGPVNVIGIYDSIEEKYYILHTKAPIDTGSTLELLDYKKYLDSNVELEPKVYQTEKSLLWAFVHLLDNLSPDVIISFTNFDMLYIMSRMQSNRIPLRVLSPIGHVRISSSERVHIGGIDVIDLAECYRIAIEQPKWETLESIVQRELNMKMLYKDKDMFKSWYEDYRIVIWRNIRDVEAIKTLDEECSLLTYFDTVKRAVGCNLSDVFTYLPSNKVANTMISDILYLRHLHNKIVLPIKKPMIKKGYVGALVFPSTKGLHTNVLVIDWNEMYPSIMDTFNMSYDTYAPEDGDINIDGAYRFSSKHRGWTPSILDVLRPIRAEKKKQIKLATDNKETRRLIAISNGYKAIINAVYGLYGFKGKTRLGKEDVAAAVCYVGRMIQIAVETFLKELGYTMLYGDTDSIFVQLKEGTEKEIEKLILDINKLLKKFMKDRWNVESKLYLGRDKLFSRLMMLTKKRYKGKTANGKIVTKGIEEIKRDTAEVSADAQGIVSNMELDGKSREDILKYAQKIVKEYPTYLLTYIAIPKNLGKPFEDYAGVSDNFKGTPGHVKAFYKGQKLLDEPLEEGTRFYTVYAFLPKDDQSQRTLSGEPIMGTKSEAIGFLDPDKVKYRVDYEKMIDKTLKNKLEDMLSLVDIEWEDVINECD